MFGISNLQKKNGKANLDTDQFQIQANIPST